MSLYILFSNVSTYSPNYTRIHVKNVKNVKNLLNLTKCELDGFDCLLANKMPRLSEGLILHVRQHEIVWKYEI